MCNNADKSFEAQVLDRNPRIRKAVSESTDFIVWRDSLRSVIVDEERFFIRGGDLLRDEDQIIFEWARKHGLLPDALIERNDAMEGGDIDQ
jgi:hypothetical protein